MLPFRVFPLTSVVRQRLQGRTHGGAQPRTEGRSSGTFYGVSGNCVWSEEARNFASAPLRWASHQIRALPTQVGNEFPFVRVEPALSLRVV